MKNLLKLFYCGLFINAFIIAMQPKNVLLELDDAKESIDCQILDNLNNLFGRPKNANLKVSMSSIDFKLLLCLINLYSEIVNHADVNEQLLQKMILEKVDEIESKTIITYGDYLLKFIKFLSLHDEYVLIDMIQKKYFYSVKILPTHTDSLHAYLFYKKAVCFFPYLNEFSKSNKPFVLNVSRKAWELMAKILNYWYIQGIANNLSYNDTALENSEKYIETSLCDYIKQLANILSQDIFGCYFDDLLSIASQLKLRPLIKVLLSHSFSLDCIKLEQLRNKIEPEFAELMLQIDPVFNQLEANAEWVSRIQKDANFQNYMGSINEAFANFLVKNINNQKVSSFLIKCESILKGTAILNLVEKKLFNKFFPKFDIHIKASVIHLDKSQSIASIRSSIRVGKKIIVGLSNGRIEKLKINLKKYHPIIYYTLAQYHTNGDTQSLGQHASFVNDICILNSAGQLATCSEDKTIKIINWRTGDLQGLLLGHTEGINSLALWKDNLLISAAADRKIMCWDLDSRQCIKTLNGHDNSVTCIGLLNNNQLISGSWDNTLRIWNLDRGECTKTVKLPGQINCLKILNEDSVVIAYDNMLAIINIATGQNKVIAQHESNISCIAIVGKDFLIAGSNDGIVKQYDINNRFNIIGTWQQNSSIKCLEVLDNDVFYCGTCEELISFERPYFSNFTSLVKSCKDLKS